MHSGREIRLASLPTPDLRINLRTISTFSLRHRPRSISLLGAPVLAPPVLGRFVPGRNRAYPPCCPGAGGVEEDLLRAGAPRKHCQERPPPLWRSLSRATNVIAATTITGDTPCRSTNVDCRLDTPSARSFLAGYVAVPQIAGEQRRWDRWGGSETRKRGEIRAIKHPLTRRNYGQSRRLRLGSEVGSRRSCRMRLERKIAGSR